MAFTAQNSSQTGLCNVKVELYGFSTIHHNCRSKPKPQVQLDPLGPLRFKLRSKAVVEYRSNHNLRLIAEGLDAAFESSHRSAHCVEAGSYHHERRTRRCADGHADALPPLRRMPPRRQRRTSFPQPSRRSKPPRAPTTTPAPNSMTCKSRLTPMRQASRKSRLSFPSSRPRQAPPCAICTSIRRAPIPS